MDPYSYLSNAEGGALDALYQRYQEDPANVEEGWRRFFEGFEFGSRAPGASASAAPLADSDVAKEIKVLNLIDGYRRRGHLFTKTNPLGPVREFQPSLDLENFGLGDEDLDTSFQAGSEIGLGPAKLRDIVKALSQTYCRTIGAEYHFIRKPEQFAWLREKMESTRNTPRYSKGIRRQVFQDLQRAVVFEQYLHQRFVGQKRFSLEGGEALIPAALAMISRGTDLGVEEFVFGMAHRGRLNILANVFRKTFEGIFSGIEGYANAQSAFEGDVIYHVGNTNTITLPDGRNIKLTMASNPSHLEAVNPVVQGIARAKLDRKYERDLSRLCPVLIHGDAAIAGQGVTYETAQMSQLKGYRTGGTVHIVINNQIGFTTDPEDARSSTYCTDVAKVTQSPVFHVNGDDVEAVVFAMSMAVEFRQKFNKDVYIDIVCYRKHGHNEADEPRYTQPKLYGLISKHDDPLKIYSAVLREAGVVSEEEAKQTEKEFRDQLDSSLEKAKKEQQATMQSYLEGSWGRYRLREENDFFHPMETAVDESTLRGLANKVFRLPPDKDYFRKMERLFDERRKTVESGRGLDWAICETLAYATLLREGFPIRLTGQDVERGTFSHRHAVVVLDDMEHYRPLNHIGEGQSRFRIYNSLLSEYAALGFEYGYSTSHPDTLTIWEAQFGDFSNTAQAIIDNFLAASETKWQRMSGLVMYLPHGQEGQGPEHSSARLERFLSLAAGGNMQVMNPTTPANLFHMLRRHMHFPFRVPLIVMTPKSGLRHPLWVNSLDDLTHGHFREVFDDPFRRPDEVKKLILCSGRVFYDLHEYREKHDIRDTAIVRIEQLHPFPEDALAQLMESYRHIEAVSWVQEEPENMGAWSYINRLIGDASLGVVSRRESGSPAVGYKKLFAEQHDELMRRAFEFESTRPRSILSRREAMPS